MLEFTKKYKFMSSYVKKMVIVDIPCTPLKLHSEKLHEWNATKNMLDKLSQISL